MITANENENGAIMSETFDSGRLLEQIVTASTSLLEEQEERKNSRRNSGEDDTLEEDEDEREYSEDGDEEVFEDGDEVVDDNVSEDNESSHDASEHADSSASPRDSVAAVLTELSQVTSLPSLNHLNRSINSTGIAPQPSRPFQQPPRTTTTTTATTTAATAVSPHMAATISSINALLQSHLNGGPSSSHKVRLSGPIRANINIRHGVWAPRLRCRKRKNLHAKDGIWIHPACTLEHLINLVKNVLPDEFEWDAQASPLRYQAVNDQSLQSLKTVSGTVSSGQSLYSAFDLVRNRRSDGDNFILQLYVYGTWTVLLKPHLTASTSNSTANDDESGASHASAINLQPPPKKKYQQAHYNQLQMNLQAEEETPTSSVNSSSSMFSHMRINPTGVNASNSASSTAAAVNYTHPLAANPPVTFLPTVTLEMKLNGTFLPVEVSRRSFIAAIRACSVPKTLAAETVKASESKGYGPQGNSSNLTPPPSEA